MKRLLSLLLLLCFFSGCSSVPPAQIAATTLPVYEFTTRLRQGTNLPATRLGTELVSCLHDYSLNVSQVKAAEAAETIVISGAGLEEFLHGVIGEEKVIDASLGLELICPEEEHDHGYEGHHHESDPHIWLSPVNAKVMAQNISLGLSQEYPAYTPIFEENLAALLSDLDTLQSYGEDTLAQLSCRELVTFHDGFAYMADAFDLTILKAVEEESGREASAKELIEMIRLVDEHHLPAIFTEKSGSVSAAGIIARETDCRSFALDMAMAGDSYFEAMYHNIDTIQEALK